MTTVNISARSSFPWLDNTLKWQYSKSKRTQRKKKSKKKQPISLNSRVQFFHYFLLTQALIHEERLPSFNFLI